MTETITTTKQNEDQALLLLLSNGVCLVLKNTIGDVAASAMQAHINDSITRGQQLSTFPIPGSRTSSATPSLPPFGATRINSTIASVVFRRSSCKAIDNMNLYTLIFF